MNRVSESTHPARAIHLAHIANLLDTHTSAPQSAEKRLPRTAVSQGCAPTTDYVRTVTAQILLTPGP